MHPNRLTTPVDREQGSLFEASSQPSLVTEPGVAVSLEARATHLRASLDCLAQASELHGLQLAMDTPATKAITGRYAARTPVVLEAAATSQMRNLREAQWQFGVAGGYYPLMDSGLTTEPTAEEMRRQDFSVFTDLYGGSPQSEVRQDFRVRLLRQIT